MDTKPDGRFKKGHKLSQGTRRKGGGRKPKLNTSIRKAIDDKIESNLEAIIDKAIELAKNGNEKMIKELLDRSSLGTIKQGVDITLLSKLSPEQYEAFLDDIEDRVKVVMEKEKNLLNSG